MATSEIKIKLEIETLQPPKFATDVLVMRFGNTTIGVHEYEKIGSLIRERFPDWRGKLLVVPRDTEIEWKREGV